MPKKLGSLGLCEFPLNSVPLRLYRRGILFFSFPVRLIFLSCTQMVQSTDNHFHRFCTLHGLSLIHI